MTHSFNLTKNILMKILNFTFPDFFLVEEFSHEKLWTGSQN